jgi:hypothetical protein
MILERETKAYFLYENDSDDAKVVGYVIQFYDGQIITKWFDDDRLIITKNIDEFLDSFDDDDMTILVLVNILSI